MPNKRPNQKRIRKPTGGLFDDIKSEYWVIMEESFFAEKGHTQNRDPDPWLEIVPGRKGHLYVQGLGDRGPVFVPKLGISIDSYVVSERIYHRRRTQVGLNWGLLDRMVCHQRADDGGNYYIVNPTREDIIQFAQFIQAFKVRKATPEMRERGRALGARKQDQSTPNGD